MIGEYQGGKSTTFDALCGGREISPRGNNVKTSACKVVATNVSETIEEYALVTWKSNVELVQTISPLLGSIEPERLGFNPSTKNVFSLTEYVDFENPSHVSLIKEAVDYEEKNCGNDPATKDIIQIARFILEFYGKTKDYRKKGRCNVLCG